MATSETSALVAAVIYFFGLPLLVHGVVLFDRRANQSYKVGDLVMFTAPWSGKIIPAKISKGRGETIYFSQVSLLESIPASFPPGDILSIGYRLPVDEESIRHMTDAEKAEWRLSQELGW